MLMTTELVINWSPGDLVQSLPFLRKLERLSDGNGTSYHGSKSYLVFCILYRICRLQIMGVNRTLCFAFCIAYVDSDFYKEHAT